MLPPHECHGQPDVSSSDKCESFNSVTSNAYTFFQHFQPSSPLFKPGERNRIVASNVGLGVMLCALYLWTKEVGLSYFFKLYFLPYLVRRDLNSNKLNLYLYFSSLIIGSSCWHICTTPTPLFLTTAANSGLSFAVHYPPLTDPSWVGLVASSFTMCRMTM